MKRGFVFKGKFYERNSKEFYDLLERERVKPENKDTLIQIMGDIATKKTVK